jgi:hypothetical protein
VDCGLISKNFRDSLAKAPGRRCIFLSVPSDLDLRARVLMRFKSNRGRPFQIGWLRADAGASGGSSKTMLRGSIQPGFGPGRFTTPCVIDLGHLRASGCSRHARAAAGAVLCGGARRRAAFWSREWPTCQGS